MCGYNATAGIHNQEIRSPGYSCFFSQSSYSNDLYCVWWLIARPGFLVEFVIKDFNTERDHDVVTVTMHVMKQVRVM